MKNLGKIVIFFLLLTTKAFATVTASVSPSIIYEGDSATYSLHISGKRVKKPTLLDICGNTITSTASQTSIESINGSYAKSYTLSYEFTPTKDCTIDSVAVEVDSKVEKSNSVSLEVKPRSQDINADFTLKYEVSKKDLYVGEPFTLTLYLKQHRAAQAVDSKFIASNMTGFWVKSESKPERYNEGDYTITKVVYKLASQREGSLKINPAKLKIATRIGVNNWGTLIPQVKWRTYFSNPIIIKAKVIPNNAKIIGDLHLEVYAQKKEVNLNEAVNVVVSVVGEGNLEDIESFKPYINDVNIFDENIKIDGNKLTQKLVFVADSDFIIPSFELIYFDTKTRQVKKIKTEPIAIKVHGNAKKNEVKISREEVPNVAHRLDIEKEVKYKTDYNYVAIAFIVGLLLGLLIMFLIFRKKRSKYIIKFDVKNEKMLLIKLLPFKDEDSQVAEIVAILEANLYSSSKEKVDKKLLKEILKKYNIS